MLVFHVYEAVQQLKEEYGTNDPVRLAAAMGIDVLYDRLGSTLGYFAVLCGTPVIVLNQDLEDAQLRVVLAHELGHYALHFEAAREAPILDARLFDMHFRRMEYEANTFAAAMLLDNDEVLDYLRQGYDVFAVSSMMNTDPGLMFFKLEELRNLGYDLRLPFDMDSCFLRRVQLRAL